MQEWIDNDHAIEIMLNWSDSDEGVELRGFAPVNNARIAATGRYLKVRIETNSHMGCNVALTRGLEIEQHASRSRFLHTGRLESTEQAIGSGVIVLAHQADCLEALHHQAGAVEARRIITAPEVGGSKI